MIKKQIVTELHKPARKNFVRRKVITKHIDDLWQCDLVEMGAYASENNGYNFLLTIIDTFSKYAWAIPIKTKTGTDVTEAMKNVFLEGRHPKNLQTDDGKEFFNKKFQTLMKEYKINHYSTYSALKASIVERFNRTIKSNMWKLFSMNGSYKWIYIIHSIISKYNRTHHRTIKMKPIDVKKSNEKHLLSTAYAIQKTYNKPKYKVGDNVRISKYKHIFEKGYTPNWTTEVFKILKVQTTHPVTYLLEDYQNNPIKGGFYELELQKVMYPESFLVDKILRKRKDKVFVKWLGFDNSHNSWINKSSLI